MQSSSSSRLKILFRYQAEEGNMQCKRHIIVILKPTLHTRNDKKLPKMAKVADTFKIPSRIILEDYLKLQFKIIQVIRSCINFISNSLQLKLFKILAAYDKIVWADGDQWRTNCHQFATSLHPWRPYKAAVCRQELKRSKFMIKKKC